MLGGTILLDASAMFPVGLVGVLAVEIVAALEISEGKLGAVVAGFFLSGAIAALLTGRFVDSWGWRRSIAGASCLTASALFAIASDPGSALLLATGMILGGAGLALMMPATNLGLLRLSDSHTLVTMVTVKQAAVPVALLLSGGLAPRLAVLTGWRAPFVAGAFAVAVGIALLQRLEAQVESGRDPTRPTPVADDKRGLKAGLRSVGVAVGLASLLPGALTGFLVLSLHAAGMAPATAGLVYGMANGAGIAVRLLSGVYARHSGSDGYAPVIVLMASGGFGAMLLGASSVGLSVLGAVLAFGLGWGWPGLLFYAVMRSMPDAPAAASAIVQAGGMAGAALGPMLLGWVVGHWSWSVGWIVMGSASAMGAAGLMVARSRLSGGYRSRRSATSH